MLTFTLNPLDKFHCTHSMKSLEHKGEIGWKLLEVEIKVVEQNWSSATERATHLDGNSVVQLSAGQVCAESRGRLVGHLHTILKDLSAWTPYFADADDSHMIVVRCSKKIIQV